MYVDGPRAPGRLLTRIRFSRPSIVENDAVRTVSVTTRPSSGVR